MDWLHICAECDEINQNLMNILKKEVETVVFIINSKADGDGKNKAPNYLDELQASGKSDDESDIDISHQGCAKIYTQPQADPFWDNSDVDSVNEEKLTINNLSGNQL